MVARVAEADGLHSTDGGEPTSGQVAYNWARGILVQRVRNDAFDGSRIGRLGEEAPERRTANGGAAIPGRMFIGGTEPHVLHLAKKGTGTGHLAHNLRKYGVASKIPM